MRNLSGVVVLFFACCFSFGYASEAIAEYRESGRKKTDGRGLSMSFLEKKLMSTADLVKLARVKSSGAVAEQYRQSLPIPVIKSEGLRVVFLYSPALALPKQPVKLNPPQYMLQLSALTGNLFEIRSVNSGDFGQSHGASDLIGTFMMPEGMTFETFIHKQDSLFQLYDTLMPEFVLRRTTASEETRKSAKEFDRLFHILSEPPLLPYYRAAGKEFFDWLAQINR
jgi:hypothetical protein